ncbi:MAG: hypothetical protein ACFE9D_01960 [Promethearchaeota archaeon]
MSLPAWVEKNNITGHVNTLPSISTARLQAVLKRLITHLNYLLRLSEAGFQLEIIAEEGFWSAWTPLQGIPSRDLYHLLSPPEATL